MQEIELGLESFDYSLLSAVRERLLQDLLTIRRNERSNITLLNGLMTDDELDCVTAARGNYIDVKEELKWKNL